jgi:lipopolysaccharide transport system ATP-binding protein
MASDDIAISVRSLGKAYTIAHQSHRSTSLAEAISARWRHPFGDGQQRETFWALKDVSFDVHRGEILGIIGRNGAGKSTLLKLLSQITGPTTGEIDINGRVASLLEVGTGFHPELTGRENIYLNGSILGMKRREINRKFDEIVAFSEIEKFLDTPVKRYSSGMYVRLAFAVAAHLETEIMIVDEVLAVGDAGFQRKCLGKMEDVTEQGRTVLVVSHQTQFIQTIATKAIFLEAGELKASGETAEVMAKYRGGNAAEVDVRAWHTEGSGEGTFTKIRFFSEADSSPEGIHPGEELGITIHFHLEAGLHRANMAIALRNADGIELFSHSWSDEHSVSDLGPGDHCFLVRIPSSVLRAGRYWLTLVLLKNDADTVSVIKGIELPPINPHPGSDLVVEAKRWGVVYIPCTWERMAEQEAAR